LCILYTNTIQQIKSWFFCANSPLKLVQICLTIKVFDLYDRDCFGNTSHSWIPRASLKIKASRSVCRTTGRPIRRECHRFAAIRVEADGVIFYPSRQLQEEAAVVHCSRRALIFDDSLQFNVWRWQSPKISTQIFVYEEITISAVL